MPLDLFVQVQSSTVAGESHVLTQQAVGVRGGFRRQLHAVVRDFLSSRGVNRMLLISSSSSAASARASPS